MIFLYTNNFSILLCVACDSKVNFYVLMWSPRQQYVFLQDIIDLKQHITCLFFISFTCLTVFLLFYIFSMFHFNCCLNKIFVIVIVKQELSKSLTLIINQMLTTRIFPELLKL